MKIDNDSAEKLNRILERASELRKYVVNVYVLDKKSQDYILNFVKRYCCYNGIDYHTLDQLNRFMVRLSNGSFINIIPCDEQEIRALFKPNAIFLDNRIKEDYIKEYIQPKVFEFGINDKTKILNPKLIRIIFQEDDENEEA